MNGKDKKKKKENKKKTKKKLIIKMINVYKLFKYYLFIYKNNY